MEELLKIVKYWILLNMEHRWHWYIEHRIFFKSYEDSKDVGLNYCKDIVPINWYDSRQWKNCARGDWDVHKFRTGYVKFKIPMTDGKVRWISIYSMCVYTYMFMVKDLVWKLTWTPKERHLKTGDWRDCRWWKSPVFLLCFGAYQH